MRKSKGSIEVYEASVRSHRWLIRGREIGVRRFDRVPSMGQKPSMGKVKAGRRTLFGITSSIDTEKMVRARRFIKRGSDLNVRLFRATNGRLGSRWRVGRRFIRGIPVCLLTTTGRKSGLARTSPLLYLLDGKGIVVVASQGGMPRHPDWYFNITADPLVHIELPGERFDAVARTANSQERAQLWPRLVEMYPSFAVYQARAGREIPVVICRPS